jgi:hypothetical protein
MFKRSIFLFVVVFILVILYSCATTYQPMTAFGGYTDTQLDKNVFSVVVKSNQYTSKERTEDFALLRCAELTLQHGYEYFIIIDADNYVKTTKYTTANLSNNTLTGTTNVNAITNTMVKPRSSNTISCFIEKPEFGFSYNAKFIYDSLSLKYGIGE